MGREKKQQVLPGVLTSSAFITKEAFHLSGDCLIGMQHAFDTGKMLRIGSVGIEHLGSGEEPVP